MPTEMTWWLNSPGDSDDECDECCPECEGEGCSECDDDNEDPFRQCGGVTLQGARCRVTSMSRHAAARPLECGGRFCAHHISQQHTGGYAGFCASEDEECTECDGDGCQECCVECSGEGCAECCLECGGVGCSMCCRGRPACVGCRQCKCQKCAGGGCASCCAGTGCSGCGACPDLDVNDGSVEIQKVETRDEVLARRAAEARETGNFIDLTTADDGASAAVPELIDLTAAYPTAVSTKGKAPSVLAKKPMPSITTTATMLSVGPLASRRAITVPAHLVHDLDTAVSRVRAARSVKCESKRVAPDSRQNTAGKAAVTRSVIVKSRGKRR